MSLIGTRAFAATVSLVAALAVGAPAAFAGTYTLDLAVPSSGTVGQPLVIQATGSNPADDFFSSWLDVAAIPTSVLSACPAGYLNASQVASSTSSQGGENVATALREDVDSAGNFAMPIAWTPGTAGRFLICGYTNDGATGTLTTASKVIDVQGATAPAPGPTPGPSPSPSPGPVAPAPAPVSSSPAVAKPAVIARPSLRRVGKKLACGPGSWANSPSGYSFSWLVNGKTKRGATGRTVRITRALRGKRAQCKVTAANAGGLATAVSRALRIR
jgi:hypothetical protein